MIHMLAIAFAILLSITPCPSLSFVLLPITSVVGLHCAAGWLGSTLLMTATFLQLFAFCPNLTLPVHALDFFSTFVFLQILAIIYTLHFYTYFVFNSSSFPFILTYIYIYIYLFYCTLKGFR